MEKNNPKAIIIHHTAVRSSSPQALAVNEYHRSKDFPRSSYGSYIGYHWFIEKDGETIKARRDTDEGAHTLGGWNRKSIGICLAGDFNRDLPTDEQLVSLKELIDKYQNVRYPKRKLKLMLHREAQKNRTCPGKNFTWDLLEDTPDDDVKCAGLEAKIKEQQTLIQQLLDFIINKLT